MGNVIVLANCTDDSAAHIFEKLKANVSPDCSEQTESHAFIQYIEQTGKIDEELLDFLYHSDFLSQITENSLPFIKRLYEDDAQIEWFYLVQKIFEEVNDSVDAYVSLVEQCYSSGIELSIIEQALDCNGQSDIAFFQEKMVPYLKKQEKEDTNPQEESAILAEHFERMSSLLQAAYERIREYKKLEMTMKMQIASLERNNNFGNRLLERERKKNADFFMRVQELEEENDTLQENVAILKEQIEVDKKRESEQGMKADRVFSQETETVEIMKEADSGNELEAAWENALNDDEDDLNMPEEVEEEEDYSSISFVAVESDQKEDEPDEIVSSEIPDEPYVYSDVKNVSSGEEVIKRKSKWFFGHLFGHSKKNFLKKSRKDQEGLIFIKMMELHFPIDKSKIVKEGLSDFGDKVSCFELYRLICKNPSNDELLSFFGNFNGGVGNEG